MSIPYVCFEVLLSDVTGTFIPSICCTKTWNKHTNYPKNDIMYKHIVIVMMDHLNQLLKKQRFFWKKTKKFHGLDFGAIELIWKQSFKKLWLHTRWKIGP